ncbi:hypothetical protein M3O60_19170 [Xanthomonas nasturtii]|nr:hypothetical protein [Xanthomonas nasturtii]
MSGLDFRQQLPEPGALGTLGVFPRRQFPQGFLGCLVLHAWLIELGTPADGRLTASSQQVEGTLKQEKRKHKHKKRK